MHDVVDVSAASIDLRRILVQVQQSIVCESQAQGYIGVSLEQTLVDLEGWPRTLPHDTIRA